MGGGGGIKGGRRNQFRDLGIYFVFSLFCTFIYCLFPSDFFLYKRDCPNVSVCAYTIFGEPKEGRGQEKSITKKKSEMDGWIDGPEGLKLVISLIERFISQWPCKARRPPGFKPNANNGAEPL